MLRQSGESARFSCCVLSDGVLGNGAEMFHDNDGLTDSDADEFCDTSDLPDDQLVSAFLLKLCSLTEASHS